MSCCPLSAPRSPEEMLCHFSVFFKDCLTNKKDFFFFFTTPFTKQNKIICYFYRCVAHYPLLLSLGYQCCITGHTAGSYMRRRASEFADIMSSTLSFAGVQRAEDKWDWWHSFHKDLSVQCLNCATNSRSETGADSTGSPSEQKKPPSLEPVPIRDIY